MCETEQDSFQGTASFSSKDLWPPIIGRSLRQTHSFSFVYYSQPLLPYYIILFLQQHVTLQHKTMATPQISSPSVWTSISDPWSSQPACNDDPSPYSSPFLGLSDFDNMSDHASSTSSSAHVLRVAIIGGGLGGACLMRGLMRYPHIVADLYDARPQFRDEGPALDLSEAHQEVLRSLDPALDACLDRAGAVYSSVALCVGTAATNYRTIDVSGLPIPGRRTVSRQALLDEILADVPPYLLHTNTPITAVSGAAEGDGGGGGAFLEFVDGTRRRYDVVVGSDGAHGLARSFVVSGQGSGQTPAAESGDEEDPAHKPIPAGSWTLPLVVPLARAQQAMGPGYLDPQGPCRAGWIGDGIFMQHDLINHGRDVQISLSAVLPPPPPANSRHDPYPGPPGPIWAKLFTPEEFEATFAQNRSPACQGMVKVSYQSLRPIKNQKLTGNNPARSKCLHYPDRGYRANATRTHRELLPRPRLPLGWGRTRREPLSWCRSWSIARARHGAVDATGALRVLRRGVKGSYEERPRRRGVAALLRTASLRCRVPTARRPGCACGVGCCQYYVRTRRGWTPGGSGPREHSGAVTAEVACGP